MEIVIGENHKKMPLNGPGGHDRGDPSAPIIGVSKYDTRQATSM
jgi:hypothetical protein